MVEVLGEHIILALAKVILEDRAAVAPLAVGMVEPPPTILVQYNKVIRADMGNRTDLEAEELEEAAIAPYLLLQVLQGE